MSPSPRIRIRARLATALVAVAALVLTVGAPAAADPAVVLASDITPDHEVVLSQSQPGWIDVDVRNLSGVTTSFGLGATLHDPAVVEPVWTLAFPGAAARADVTSGATYHEQIPAWPGMGYVVYRDIDTVPAETAVYTVPGRFFPYDISGTEDDFVMQLGHHVTVTPAIGRAGEALNVTTSGLPLSLAEVWIVPAGSLGYDFGGEWDFTTDGATSLGIVPVVGGAVNASVAMPAGLAPDSYAVLVGEPGGAWIPAGPALSSAGGGTFGNLTIEAGDPRTLTPDGVSDVVPLDQNGAQPVSFHFPASTHGGTTTVTTSTTGPTPTGFTALTGASPAYYQLSSTATFAPSMVTVCITFDTAGMTPTDAAGQHLYHFVAGAWQDITNPGPGTAGRVCGDTGGFSPFAVGRPVAPASWPFTGFLNLSKTAVNAEFAGAIVPIRFTVGGNRGLDILAAGSPASGQVACNVAAIPASLQPASALVASQPLQYARVSGTYWYLWKTSTAWAGTCRQFVMKLDDGTVHRVTFKFSKLGLLQILQVIFKIL
jgi:hypothetical protein